MADEVPETPLQVRPVVVEQTVPTPGVSAMAAPAPATLSPAGGWSEARTSGKEDSAEAVQIADVSSVSLLTHLAHPPAAAANAALPDIPAAETDPLKESLDSAERRRELWLTDVLEEAVVHRVLQRVDIGLDQRLRDAIATVVQEQTRSLLPRLREEVESVVRQVVYEAMADEVANGSARKPHPS